MRGVSGHEDWNLDKTKVIFSVRTHVEGRHCRSLLPFSRLQQTRAATCAGIHHKQNRTSSKAQMGRRRRSVARPKMWRGYWLTVGHTPGNAFCCTTRPSTVAYDPAFCLGFDTKYETNEKHVHLRNCLLLSKIFSRRPRCARSVELTVCRARRDPRITLRVAS